jgi:hypothetical protein
MITKVEELSDIIKLCSKSGVSRLKVGEIEINFTENTEKREKLAEKTVKVRDNPKGRAEVEQESIGRDEQKLKEDYVDNLLLEDPSEYERLAIQGELDEETNNRAVEQTLQ